MATVAYGIKTLGKLGAVQHQGTSYWVDYRGYRISFLTNGEDKPENSLTCEHVQRVGEVSDPQSDYYPGSFYANLSQAIASVMRRVTEEVSA